VNRWVNDGVNNGVNDGINDDAIMMDGVDGVVA
jgi:hypothetical protein